MFSISNEVHFCVRPSKLWSLKFERHQFDVFLPVSLAD
jgi:hypothetical protein